MKKMLVIVLVLSLILVGCGSSKDENLKELSQGVKNIDWDKTIEKTMEELSDSKDHPYVEDLHIELREKEREIIFTAALTDSTDEDLALDFANIMIKRFSKNVALDNEGVKGPEGGYFGEVFDYYNIGVGVAPFSEMEETDNWYVFQRIKHEEHEKIKLNK